MKALKHTWFLVDVIIKSFLPLIIVWIAIGIGKMAGWVAGS